MPPEDQTSAPTVHTTTVTAPEPSRIGSLKLAFLYVLIVGLAASALTAIIALLVGSFNSTILNALQTIFVFFSHSLLLLALLWADRYNEVGRQALPTTIFALVFANMLTSTLSTWGIISDETSWRALGLYVLILGVVFVITGILKLRISHRATKALLYSAIAIISALITTLAPWVLKAMEEFDPLYFRVVAALSILASTIFLIALILRGIALTRNSALQSTAPAWRPISGGMLAIYITVGSIAAMVLCAGLTSFIVSAVQADNPIHYTTPNRYY